MSDAGAERHVVVVGASLAGIRCVEALRSEGFTGRITLIGAEPHLPYDRPPLSKRLLTAGWSEESAASIRLTDTDRVDALDVELSLGTPATALDPAARLLRLADGTEVSYDVAVIATGAAPRPSPWQPASGLYMLRTLHDARALSERLTSGEPVAVIGGGFIGTEVAAAARSHGCAVTIIDPVAAPMARLVGPEMARSLVDLHHRNGVTTRFGVSVVDVQGAEGELTVLLDKGTDVSASTVVVGIGSIPTTDWLVGSGLKVDDGVLCDEFLRARGAQNVFAIGDVARWPHLGRGQDVRSEHWTNAADQGWFVASVITRRTNSPYVPSDYVWSDQYDWKVQSIGWRPPTGPSLVVGDLDVDGRAALVHADGSGIACGAVTVNWPRAQLQCRRLLARQEPATAVIDELRKQL